MKTIPQTLLDLIEQPKAINARVTFRVMRPSFDVASIVDDLPVTDSSLIDSCTYGTGLLRAVNHNDVLYTQEVPDVNAATWPNWVNTGIALFPGVRIGVDDGYVWYHRSDYALCYRAYNNFATEVVISTTLDNPTEPPLLAPISNKRCYRLFVANNPRLWCTAADGRTSRHFGYFYGVTELSLDAVSYSDSLDYVYVTNRDAGRVVEIPVRIQSATKAQFGAPSPIVAIDAIDEQYGLKLHGASVIDGKVVVTGRLTRTSDGDPVSMDVYLMGPEKFTLGRDMYISGTHLGGKMNLVGSTLVVPGAISCGIAPATALFGVDSSEHKLVVSDVGNVRLQEAESRSSTVHVSLSPDLSHPALVTGAQMKLEVAYGDQWMEAFTGEVDAISRYTGAGKDLDVTATSTSAKRLGKWAPDQGVYIPSQVKVETVANDLSQIIRVGSFIDLSNSLAAGIYEDTHPHWVYNGDWRVDANQGSPSIHYARAYDADPSASFEFYGTGFKFTYTKSSDRAIHDIWVDGVKIASLDAYTTEAATLATYESPVLPADLHVFRVSSGGFSGIGTWYYIDVDKLEVFDDNTSYQSLLKPKRLNELTVLYTAARASQGGIMRARFYNEPDGDKWYRDPRFGVGLNYHRETKAEAAMRLGLNYSDTDDDMCGHNGIVAIYGRAEVDNNPGIVVYEWRNSVLTARLAYPLTLPTDTLVWLQMRYLSGYFYVSWKADGSTTWNDLEPLSIGGYFNVTNTPWDNETGGRGCVVMERHVEVTSDCLVLSSADDTIGLDSTIGSFPASGKVMVDDEIISYSAKSPNTRYIVPFWMKHSDGVMLTDSSFTTGERLLVDGQNGLLPAIDNDPTLVGCAVIPYRNETNPVYDRSYRLVAYDGVPPNIWSPNTAFAGWPIHIGDAAYGNWSAFSSFSAERCLHVLPTGINRFVNEMTNFSPPAHYVRIIPALHVSKRGEDGTAVTSHGQAQVICYADIALWVDKIEFYSSDEDITLADALRRVARLAGGEVSERKIVNQDQAALPNDAWTLLPFSCGQSDFVAEMTIPPDITATGVEVGLIFRSEAPVDEGFSDGYAIMFSGGDIKLYRTPVMTLLESISSMEMNPATLTEYAAHIPAGVVKVSVHGNRFAVWADHKLIHVFTSDLVSEGVYAAFAAYVPSTASPFTFHGHVSELHDLLSDVTVGVRGKGMSVIGEMTNNRRVLFRCEPDGSLFFFKTPNDIGVLQDIIVSDTYTEADEEVSRVRVEGIKISEIADFDAMKRLGNVFETVNSQYADTIADLEDDGLYHMNNVRQRSKTRQWETVFHPALQPGDIGLAYVKGQLVSFGIVSTIATFGFNGENFDVNAGIEVYTP